MQKKTLTNPKYRTSVWNKLYRRSVIEKSSIRFYSYSDVISEDCVFNANIFPHINKVLFIPNVVYHYEVVEGSLSHRKRYYDIVERNWRTVEMIAVGFYNNPRCKSMISYYYIESLFRLANLSVCHNKNSFSEANDTLKKYISLTSEYRKTYFVRNKVVKSVMNKGIKRTVYGMVEMLINDKLFFLLRFCLIITSKFRK